MRKFVEKNEAQLLRVEPLDEAAWENKPRIPQADYRRATYGRCLVEFDRRTKSEPARASGGKRECAMV